MTKATWRMLFGILAIFAVLALAACGDDDSTATQTATGTSASTGTSTGTAGSASATTVAAGNLAADQTFRANLGGEPDTLDPSKASFGTELAVIEQVMRGPFRFDSKLQLVPELATQVPTKDNGGISADGLTYTIKLKSGLKWSDGQPLTSRDLAYALRRAADPRYGGDYISFLWEIKGGDALSTAKATDTNLDDLVKALAIETPDDTTVKLTLAAPNGVFLQYLGLWIAYPLRQDLIEKFGDKWIDPGNMVSSGPMILKEWQHKNYILLVPNPNYYGEKATVTIRLAEIEDANQAFNAYKAGELDQVGVPSALVPQVKADPTLSKELQTVDRLSTFRVALVNTKAPFDNPKVRQAFAYAVDRKALVDVALKGVGKPATSIIPPGLPGYDEKATPNFDAAKAKQLLKDAGFENGNGLPKITFTFTNSGNNPPLATNLKEQWKNVLGVDVELDPVDSKTFTERFKAGNVQLAFVGWGADYPDPETFLSPNFKSKAGNNKSGYSNPAFDDLLAKGQLETDRARAATQYYVPAQTMMLADSPEILLFYSQFFTLRKPWVSSITNSAMDYVVVGDRSFATAKILKR